MMELKIWNRLCDKVNKKINVSEGRFEKEIALEFLGALNWSEYYDNLKEQYQIDVHGDKWIPDFALFAEGKDEPDIIVELKKPTHRQRSKDRRQITTYMKLVDCRFGLYFGEKLELFYLDYEPEKRVSKSVLSVDFIKNDKNGQQLIDLLKYDSYDRSKLRTFCENRIKLDEVCRYWCSDEGLEKLYDFIMEHSALPASMNDSLLSSLDIAIHQKKEIVEEESESFVEEVTGCAEPTVPEINSNEFVVFKLTETKKGTDATMYYYPKLGKFVVKADSKISTKQTKDCSPEASELRKAIFYDNTKSINDGNVYVLLQDVVITPKSGAPNVVANFCTGRSTNARTAWIDKEGRTFGELFPKTKVYEEDDNDHPNLTSKPSDTLSFLANCISKVSSATGSKLIRKSGNAYISSDGKNGYVFRTSKIYNQGTREKYWYAYKRNRDISDCKNQYFVFGCNDANTIIILPVEEIEAQINGLNYSQDANGNPSYWHIVFFKDKKGKMTWLLSKPQIHELDITSKML